MLYDEQLKAQVLILLYAREIIPEITVRLLVGSKQEIIAHVVEGLVNDIFPVLI